MQARPCFLVIDSEHAGMLSTRKLVLETAKYNVITAYSVPEAVVLLQRFPSVDGVVMNAVVREGSLAAFWNELAALPNVKLIVVGDSLQTPIAVQPDAVVESFAPDKLLKALRDLFPKEARQLQEHEADLERNDV